MTGPPEVTPLNSVTILPATPDTLTDLYALHPDPLETARLLETYRGRVQRGEAHLSDTLILRTPRGVEGAVTFGPAPHPYVFPHVRACLLYTSPSPRD